MFMKRIMYCLLAALSLSVFAAEKTQKQKTQQNRIQAVQAVQTLDMAPVFPSEIKVKVVEMPQKPVVAPPPKATKYIAQGYGYARASSQVTLNCKYAGYVRKIYFYSGRAVKAGDVILEYDDHAWRTKMEAAENKIRLQQETIELKTLQLKLKKLDPVPAAYRNTSQKQSAAKDKLEQLRRLHSIPTQKAQAASLAVGVIGALILGTGMSLCMTELGAALGRLALVLGILIGITGLIMVVWAYPLYKRILRKERTRIAPEILRLTDELMAK